MVETMSTSPGVTASAAACCCSVRPCEPVWAEPEPCRPGRPSLGGVIDGWLGAGAGAAGALTLGAGAARPWPRCCGGAHRSPGLRRPDRRTAARRPRWPAAPATPGAAVRRAAATPVRGLGPGPTGRDRVRLPPQGGVPVAVAAVRLVRPLAGHGPGAPGGWIVTRVTSVVAGSAATTIWGPTLRQTRGAPKRLLRARPGLPVDRAAAAPRSCVIGPRDGDGDGSTRAASWLGEQRGAEGPTSLRDDSRPQDGAGSACEQEPAGQKGSRLWESNPRPTHYEGHPHAASPCYLWLLLQLRSHLQPCHRLGGPRFVSQPMSRRHVRRGGATDVLVGPCSTRSRLCPWRGPARTSVYPPTRLELQHRRHRCSTRARRRSATGTSAGPSPDRSCWRQRRRSRSDEPTPATSVGAPLGPFPAVPHHRAVRLGHHCHRGLPFPIEGGEGPGVHPGELQARPRVVRAKRTSSPRDSAASDSARSERPCRAARRQGSPARSSGGELEVARHLRCRLSDIRSSVGRGGLDRGGDLFVPMRALSAPPRTSPAAPSRSRESPTRSSNTAAAHAVAIHCHRRTRAARPARDALTDENALVSSPA